MPDKPDGCAAIQRHADRSESLGGGMTPHEVQSGIAEPCPREELPHALVHTEGLLVGEQLCREGPGDSW